MSKQGKLLIVDDNRGILSAVKLLMDKHFAQVDILSSPNQLISTMRTSEPDVVLLDMNFSAGINTGNEGIYWLNQINEKFPDVKVVLFTAYGDIDLAVKAMQHGAVDFVVKPWDNQRLTESLHNAYRLRRGQRKAERGGDNMPHTSMFWGYSPAMQRIRDMVDKVAATDANILITGENGTGKEVLAREIHRMSMRRNHPMVSLDMGAIPESLFESELFGHAKGAFTDAHTEREGKFEAANSGTLFMDEIGNLSPAMQAKLLTALQSRSIIRLGTNTPIPVDIRLISATNRDLFSMVNDGEFRQDLLYRINTIHIDLPALRNRREDIIPMAEIFLSKYADKYGRGELRFTDKATETLYKHHWQGNIRELQHTIEKAVIMADNRDIDAEQLNLQPATKVTSDNSTLEDMERHMIREAMEQNDGNLTVVARRLGITRQTLYNKIKRYGL